MDGMAGRFFLNNFKTALHDRVVRTVMLCSGCQRTEEVQVSNAIDGLPLMPTAEERYDRLGFILRVNKDEGVVAEEVCAKQTHEE